MSVTRYPHCMLPAQAHRYNEPVAAGSPLQGRTTDTPETASAADSQGEKHAYEHSRIGTQLEAEQLHRLILYGCHCSLRTGLVAFCVNAHG